MLSEERLAAHAERLVAVPGVVGVVLGGSRARGDEQAGSDVDLGLLYRPPLGVGALRDLAEQEADARPGDAGSPGDSVTEPGAWGPWVDGGAWLSVEQTPVDWLYRDLDRVARSSADAHAGRLDFAFQVGHPLGVSTVAYAGELALARVLADPTGEITTLQAELRVYPDALRAAVLDRLDEARFLLGAVGKSAGRGDAAYVAGVLFRVVGLCAHAVHARAGRWVVNEKGLVDQAGRLATAPERFAERAHGVFALVGRDPDALHRAVTEAAALVDTV
ncbi:nucleotidyltransferase domain-containing protein [Microlunatus flavus]|uniref:Nucleotidyltransferase domain-containing protein n=1 Tax=Microlunatus flavus TaxID=1036181 RepID=A0A1H9MBQ6_9ACTN|nr:nucleotidyltransferase domain-containing protein [Microlunatus flavus]SER20573.1 Nucleotidyltransferase domain-containing protein [Microlunatus flavus]